MVQVLQNQENNIFGRLGQGFGKGVAEQLPKEIQSAREAKAIEGFKNQKNLNPLSALSKLRRAGVSLNDASSLLPYLQQASAARASIEEGNGSAQGSQIIPSTSGTHIRSINPSTPGRGEQENLKGTNTQPSVSSESSAPSGEIGPANQDLRGSSFGEPLSVPQLKNEVSKLIKSGRFIDPDKALAHVLALDEKRLAGDTAFQEKQDAVKTDLLKAWGEATLKDGKNISQDIGPDIQEKLINKAKGEVAFGGNPSQVVARYKEIGKRIAETGQNLRTMGTRNWLDTDYAQNRENINSIHKLYKSVGGLETLENELKATQGVSDHVAADFAYPLSDNLSKIFASEKPRYGGRGIGSREKEYKFAQKIADNWDELQSPLTIGLHAKEIGLDDKVIVNYLRDVLGDKINARQNLAFQKYQTPVQTAGDYWLYARTKPKK